MGGLLGVGAIVALSCLDEKVDEMTESQPDRSLSGAWTLATGDIERKCGEQSQNTPLSEMPYEFSLQQTEQGYLLADRYCQYPLQQQGAQLTGGEKRCELPIGPGNFVEIETIVMNVREDGSLQVEIIAESTMDLRGESLQCDVRTVGVAARVPRAS